MKIYTGTGDKGTTSLVGGTRVVKNHPRLQAYGTIDELNSQLGLLAAFIAADTVAQTSSDIAHTHDMLAAIQNTLFDLGSRLSTEPDSKWQPAPPDPAQIHAVEREIDRLQATLPPLRQFILPGGSIASAQAHVARTVARRAERLMVAMQADGNDIHAADMQLVNRLSDYLFVLARHINAIAGIPDTIWQPAKHD